MNSQPRYAVLISAVDVEGASDQAMYREAVGDARLVQKLGSALRLSASG